MHTRGNTKVFDLVECFLHRFSDGKLDDGGEHGKGVLLLWYSNNNKFINIRNLMLIYRVLLILILDFCHYQLFPIGYLKFIVLHLANFLVIFDTFKLV